MQVRNVERKEKSTVSFDVVIGAEEFEKALQAAYLKNRSKIYVQGFRKGKAPRMVIEGMYGKDVFYEDAADALAPEAFQFGVEQEKIRNVGSPAMRSMDVSDAKELTLGFATAEWPEAKLGEYKALTAERPVVDVKDEEIDAEVERARKRAGRIVTVERPAKEGDTAVIDFEGSVDGVPFDGGKSEGHNLVLGSKVFIPGFEEQVVGMSAGEEKDINVTFPEDYQAENLAGKPAVFHVKCSEVKEEQLPMLDDEFAKDVSEFDTLDEYKKSIRERLEKTANEHADSEFHSALLEKAAENMEVELPTAMVEEQIDNMINELAQNLQYQGISLELYLQYLGQDARSFRESQREQAEKRCRLQVLVDKIASVEDIQVTDEEINEEYKRIADLYATDEEKVRASVPVDAVKDDMRVRKAAELVYETGVAVAPEEKKAEKKPAAKKTTKKTAEKTEAAEGEKKPAAKKTTKKTAEKAEEAEGEKKPAAKKTTKKTAEKTEATEGEKKPAAKKTTKKADAE